MGCGKSASEGFSGLTLEATTRDTSCHCCKKKLVFGFLVARYRGTQSACQNLYFHI